MNAFQQMLLHDVEANEVISYSNRIIGLFFPKEEKPEIWYWFVLACIQEGMQPPEGYEELNSKSCRDFCEMHELKFGKTQDNMFCFSRK